MDFEEHAAKPLLAAAGIAVPRGETAATPGEAAAAAESLGPVVVKAQVPAGKRGKAGGIRAADDAAAARSAAEEILGMTIGGHTVERLLVEERADIARELYAAVLNDTASKGPLVLFSTLGGMDIEEAAARDANAVRRHAPDIRHGLDAAGAEALLEGLDLGGAGGAVADVLARLYGVWRSRDAELVEINPSPSPATGGSSRSTASSPWTTSRRPGTKTSSAPASPTPSPTSRRAAGTWASPTSSSTGRSASSPTARASR